MYSTDELNITEAFSLVSGCFAAYFFFRYLNINTVILGYVSRVSFRFTIAIDTKTFLSSKINCYYYYYLVWFCGDCVCWVCEGAGSWKNGNAAPLLPPPPPPPRA